MLPKSKVLKTLNGFDQRFGSASTREQLFIAKAATLEACGWIEESIDLIFLRLSAKRVTDSSVQKRIAKAIKNNYGFDYENHIKKKLIEPIFGWTNALSLEARLDPTKFQNMKLSLKALKAERDALAHTYIKGITVRINAPALTLVHFHRVADGLRDLEACLLSARFRV